MSTINIILSTYNGEKYLREQLDSIIRSSYKNWKIYISDDCSSDSTCDIVREYISTYGSKIALHVNEHNLGSTANFLSALRRVAAQNKDENGAYYMFCDQDDVWLKDKLYITLRAMKKLERKVGSVKPSLIFTDAVLADEKLEYINNSFFRVNRLNVRNLSLSRLLIENRCIGCTIMMNKALVDMVGEPCEGIRYHDWWVALIAAAFGSIRFLNVPTLLYRQHGHNQVGQTDFKTYVKQRESEDGDISKRLDDTFAQAALFHKTFKGRLSYHNSVMISEMARLRGYSFLRKRYTIVRYRFFKSGIIRNLGLFWYV